MQLRFGSIAVGDITDAFENDGTWFGKIRWTLPIDDVPTSQRLQEFAEFCKDWFARCGSSRSADAGEFDRFDEVVSSGNWIIEDTDGIYRLENAPMFADGTNGEISWIACGRPVRTE